MPELGPIFPSVVHMLQAAAQTAPDRTALVCGEDRLSYQAYFAAVLALAAELRRQDIGPGDRVVTIMANSADAAIATFGVQAAGAQLVPLNPAYTAAELSLVIADAEPKAVLHDEMLADRVYGLVSPTMLALPISPRSRRLMESANTALQGESVYRPVPEEPSTLQYTGGTTGLPKGVNLSHRAVATNVAQREALLPTADGEQVMCITPLFHVYAVSMGLYLAANCRGTLHIIRKFDAGTVLSLIENQKIGFLSASPTILLGLMSHDSFAKTNFDALKICSSGSAALPESVLLDWETATGCPVCEGYGQTEAGPVLSYNPRGGLRKPGSVGIPVPQTEIEVVDLDSGDTVLPTGEAGEIRARGPQIMSGYRNRTKETTETLRDGWLYTGDIGRVDLDGYLTICDRKKDMVISAGFNVYPREIEEVLVSHPEIAEAAVIGTPDPYRGEALIAYVIRRAPGLTQDQVMVYLGQRLTKYKWPREVRFLDTLPKTSIGKTDKAALRAM
jgi:long-chain acyl-CoA synthetase